MVVTQMSKVLSRANAKSARTLVVLALAAILTGCSSVSDLDVFGVFDEGPAAAETPGQASVRASGDKESAAASAQPTPSLSSVPARPEVPTPPDVRQSVVEGLAADRENARYSDESIRLQGASRESAGAATTATTKPTTTAPPPPQVGSTSDGRPGSPTQIVPPARPQTASTPPPPEPVPLPKGPGPSVRVDTTAISGGTDLPTSASRFTVDEQVATIHFAHSSSKLDDRDRSVIAAVASAQRQNDAEVIVVGHASGRTQQLDKAEHELANFRISLARANRVAEQLISMGVASDKVRVEAVANGKPRFSEAMPTGEAGNRRAEIYFRQ